MPVYLDFNATTPIHPEVLETMMIVYQQTFGNAGSRTHLHGLDAKRLVDESRVKIAGTLGISPQELIFTSGATESNNLAILGLEDYGNRTGRRHILSTMIEHHSVLAPLEILKSRGFDVELCPVDRSGQVNVDVLIQKIRQDTLLVSVMHANNETGVIQPVEDIGKFLKDSDTFFHVDAAQTFGKLQKELFNLDYDFLSITGHKIGGPQGIGALVLKTRSYKRPPIQPLTFGGGQEKGLRPGTIPTALVAGFATASELYKVHADEWRAREEAIKLQIVNQLASTSFAINGYPQLSMPNCLNISFSGIDSEALMLAVKQDISISNGSACTSYEYKPSHVLEAMSIDAESAIRLSWGPQTVDVDVSTIIDFVNSLV